MIGLLVVVVEVVDLVERDELVVVVVEDLDVELVLVEDGVDEAVVVAVEIDVTEVGACELAVIVEGTVDLVVVAGEKLVLAAIGPPVTRIPLALFPSVTKSSGGGGTNGVAPK